MAKARSEMKAQLGALASRHRMTVAQFVYKRGLKTAAALVDWCNNQDVEPPNDDELAQLFCSVPTPAPKPVPASTPEKKVSSTPPRKKKKAAAKAEADDEHAEESSTGSTRM